MEANPQDQNREHRRRRLRREHSDRRRRERRWLLAGLGAVALIGIVVLAAGLVGERRKEVRELAAKDPGPSALERAKLRRGEGERATREVLGYTDFLRAGRPLKRQVALTFDDGPGPHTNQVLRILRRHDAPATFFISGNMLDGFADLARKELRQGHAIGNHGEDHMRLGEQTNLVQAEQIADVDFRFAELGAPEPSLFRPPYGSFDATTLELLEEREKLMVLWSVDTGDYENPGTEVIVERALDGVKPGDVILMHDAGGDRSQTVAALPQILEGLKRRKLEPVTVPELLIANPPPRGQTLEQAEAVAAPGEGLADPLG